MARFLVFLTARGRGLAGNVLPSAAFDRMLSDRMIFHPKLPAMGLGLKEWDVIGRRAFGANSGGWHHLDLIRVFPGADVAIYVLADGSWEGRRRDVFIQMEQFGPAFARQFLPPSPNWPNGLPVANPMTADQEIARLSGYYALQERYLDPRRNCTIAKNYSRPDNR